MIRASIILGFFLFMAATYPGGQAFARNELSPEETAALRDIAANHDVLVKAYERVEELPNTFTFERAVCKEMEMQPEAFIDFMIAVHSDPILLCYTLVNHEPDRAEVNAWSKRALKSMQAYAPDTEERRDMHRKCIISLKDTDNQTR